MVLRRIKNSTTRIAAYETWRHNQDLEEAKNRHYKNLKVSVRKSRKKKKPVDYPPQVRSDDENDFNAHRPLLSYSNKAGNGIQSRYLTDKEWITRKINKKKKKKEKNKMLAENSKMTENFKKQYFT